MKTKSIPAIIMLTAGGIACIAGIASRMDAVSFTEMLLIVLLIFYALGCIVKIVIDSNFKEETVEAVEEETTDDETVLDEEDTKADAEKQKDTQ